MDLERQWRIRDLSAGILATAYGRHGATARDRGVIVDTDKAGKVTLRRPTVGHETARTQADGGPRVVQQIDHDDETRLRRAVERFADLHMALIARDACLRDAGIGYDEVPTWSVVADSLLVHVAGRLRDGLSDMCRLTVSNGSSVADDEGFSLSPAGDFHVRDGARDYRGTIMRGWLSGGVVGHQFKIRCGADGATTYDGKRRPTLTVMDQTLPDALLAGMAGRRLDDVVSHPVLAGSRATISSIANVEGNVPRLDVRLRRDRARLAPAPDGIDTPWLDTIAELSA